MKIYTAYNLIPYNEKNLLQGELALEKDTNMKAPSLRINYTYLVVEMRMVKD
jgi:hypothetical protein